MNRLYPKSAGVRVIRPASRRAGLAIVLLLSISVPLLSQKESKKEAEKSAAPAKAAEAAVPVKLEAIGVEMCVTCHEDKGKWVAKSPHKECESCHGPGSKHAETTSPADIGAHPGQASCRSCHKQHQPHANSSIQCSSCHSIHETQTKAELGKLCGTCHLSSVAEFMKPFRHKVPEGVMSCLDCHKPHGKPMRTNFNEPPCLRCHGDKRGPFVYEHAPVRTEGCNSCHEPHGSANPRLLTRNTTRVQCLECHSGVGLARQNLGGSPPAFHDQRSARFQNCTGCHMKIHGSQVNRDFLR